MSTYLILETRAGCPRWSLITRWRRTCSRAGPSLDGAYPAATGSRGAGSCAVDGAPPASGPCASTKSRWRISTSGQCRGGKRDRPRRSARPSFRPSMNPALAAPAASPRRFAGTVCMAWRMLPLLTDWRERGRAAASGVPLRCDTTELPSLAGQDAAERRHAGGDADLAERRVDAGGHPGARRLDHADRGRGQRDVDEPGADAGDDQPGQQVRPVVAGRDPAHQHAGRRRSARSRGRSASAWARAR